MFIYPYTPKSSLEFYSLRKSWKSARAVDIGVSKLS